MHNEIFPTFPLSHFPTFLCKMGLSKREVKNLVLFFAFLLPCSLLNAQTPSIPTLPLLDCGDWTAQITPVIWPSSCTGCCVQTSCTKSLYQVRLQIKSTVLSSYNNGNFYLEYTNLGLTLVTGSGEPGELSRINVKDTETCLSSILSGSGTADIVYSQSVDESNNSVTLLLSDALIVEQQDVLPTILFTNGLTEVLLTLVVDTYPGDYIGASIENFLYTDDNQFSCTSIAQSGMIGTYPAPTTENGNFELSIGSGNCTEDNAEFIVELTSTVSSVIEYLDFSIFLSTNTKLLGPPTVTALSGFPSPTDIQFVPLPSDGGYNIRLIYENVTLNGTADLVKISAEPIDITGGYSISTELNPGRLAVTGLGCEKPSVDKTTTDCAQAALTACSDYTILAEGAYVQFGDCEDLEVYISLTGPNAPGDEDLDDLQIRIDFILDPGVTMTGYNLNVNPCTGCVVTLDYTNNIVYFDASASGITWDNGDYLVINFNAPDGCIQDALVRIAELQPDGNPDHCQPEVEMLNFPNCTTRFSGKVATIGTECYVENVELLATPDSDPTACPNTNLTGCGPYSNCITCTNYDKWTVTPKKVVDLKEGVTTADILVIRNHILGVGPLPTPYQIIAGDVNKSNTLQTFDIVEIRKLILGIYDQSNWPSGYADSWRFVPEDFVFPNSMNPFQTSFPESIDNISLPNDEINFIAIKTGDVNLSLNYPFICSDCNAWPFQVPTQPFGINLNSNRYEVAGEYVTIPVYAASNAPLKAWQLAVRFDPNVWSFVGVSKGNLKGMTPNDFGLTQVKDGIVRALWVANPADEEDHLHAGDCLFYITLKAKKAVQSFANLLTLSPESMECTGTTDGYDSFVLTDQEATVTERIQEDAAEYWVATGYPNPFTESFQVQVSIPEASKIRLLVLDAFGRPIVLRDQPLDKGQHTLSVDEAAQLPTGVYRWEIRTGPITRAGGVLVKQ